MNKIWLILICAIAFAGVAFADISISASSVTPTTLRPGNTGSVSFTLTNTGSYTITGLTLSPSGYGFEFSSDKISIGTIGASGSTPVSIQFRVSPSVESGVYNMMIPSYWNDQSISGGTGYKLIQIPVTVTKQTIFQIYSSPKTVGIGDDFEMDVEIKNTGSKASNVVLAMGSAYFVAKDNTRMNLGTIGAGETRNVTIQISTSLAMPAGVYSVPVTISFQDELGTIQQTTATLGTVQTVKGFVDFSVTPNTDSAAVPGKKIKLTLSVRNDGTLVANSVRCSISSSSSNFLPIGSSQRIIGDIKPGATAEFSYEVGIDADSSPGYYPVTVTLDYLNKQGETQTTISKIVGLEVVGDPKLSVITSTTPFPVAPGGKYSVSIQVSNIGTTDVKSLRTDVQSDAFTVLDNAPMTFIGNLKMDDYSQVSYQILVKSDVKPGKYPITVKMNFLDAYNNEREIIETTYLQVVSPEVIALSGNGNGGGLDMWTMLLLLLVIVVVAYLVYRKFFRKNGNGKK